MSLNGQSETELLKTIATNTGASASSTTAGIIDSGNSSTANLSGDAVFTGVWKDTTIYSQFTVIYSADVEGTINMDLSMDGSTVHRSKVVEDTTGGVHTLAVVSKFMRVRWTNGSDAQSTFALQTILHIHKSKDLTSTMVQQVSNNNDVTLVRDPTIAIWDTAREFYTGKTVEHFIGENDAVTTTWTDVYPSGTHDYPFQIAAQSIEVVSSDANDSGISTGVLTLAANAADGDTFTIGSRTYTLQDTLTDVDGNIHIGANAAATVITIVNGITGGANSGVDYAASMVTNTSVTAADGTGDTVDFTSLPAFYLANDGDLEVLATTETGDDLSFGAVAMVHPTGAQTLEIHGLSSTGADQEEIIHLNGTTAVDCALTYLRINQFHLQGAGTKQGSNFGNILLRIDGGGATLSQIKGFEATGAADYGHGEGNSGVHTIPLNKIAYLTALEVDVDSSKAANVVLYEAEGCTRSASPFLPRRVLWQGFNLTGNINHTFDSPIKVKPLTDLWFRALLSTGTGGVAVKLDWLQAVPNSSNK